MELYYHHDATVLDKYTRMFVPKLKGMLLETLNRELSMEGLSYSVYSYVDIDSKNKRLYFTIGTRTFNVHKRFVMIYKVHPVLLGKVKCPFFKGFDPYQNEEI